MSKPEIPNLTPETAILILNKTLDALEIPENVQRLEDAKNNVGNEMLKMMQFLFPIVMQVQVDVLKDFGFPDTRDTSIKFAQMLRNIEREDPEVSRLHSLIKAYYLPPVSVNATNESPADDRITSN